MEAIKEKLKSECEDILHYGTIITDFRVPAVNSRFLNIYYDDTFYFIHMMNGEFMVVQNLNDKVAICTEYGKIESVVIL